MKINDRVRVLSGFDGNTLIEGRTGRVDAMFPAYVAVDLDNGEYVGAAYDDLEVLSDA